jgi:hypothetical protein
LTPISIGMLAVLVGGARGDHDQRDVPQALVATDVARQVEAVHARHFDVEQHDVGHHIGQLFQRIDAVLGGQHVVAVAGQQPAADLAHRERIVDHHHGRRCGAVAVGAVRTVVAVSSAGTAGASAIGVVTTDAGRCCARRARGQGHGVQDQCDFAIGQHRGAGQAGNAGQLRSDGLDHDFLVAGQAIDFQRDALGTALDQQDPVPAPAAAVAFGIAQQFAPDSDRDRDCPAIRCYLLADLRGSGGAVFGGLLDHRGRHRIVAAADVTSTTWVTARVSGR